MCCCFDGVVITLTVSVVNTLYWIPIRNPLKHLFIKASFFELRLFPALQGAESPLLRRSKRGEPVGRGHMLACGDQPEHQHRQLGEH